MTNSVIYIIVRKYKWNNEEHIVDMGHIDLRDKERVDALCKELNESDTLNQLSTYEVRKIVPL